ncbi:MAG: glycogen synthase [Anaerolineae bacterium]|jgi:starch synthase
MNDGKLNILFLSPEVVPLAKVGELADVAGALPKALRALGHDVRVMVPRYGSIRSDRFGLEKVGKPFPVPCGPGEERAHLVRTAADQGAPIYLIWDEKFFSPRERVYGFDDDPQRFVFFGRAAIAALSLLDWMPDVIHANDWHTAVVPTWLAYEGRYLREYRHLASLFTIHNLAYQGISGRLILTFAQMEYVKHLDVEPPGRVNWMGQGIANADLINTVSSRYAQEILQPEGGAGLDSLLRRRRDRLFGVLNGIDYDLWDPSADPHLPQRFDRSSLKMRAVNKAALQQAARLPVRDEVPLVAMISPLKPVEGMGLLESVLERLLENNVQFVLLTTGEPEYQERAEALRARFPDRVRIFRELEEALTRRIYAGCDLFLMPYRFEPCGLGQMIAMHYGAVPVVHRTGGLAETVTDYHARPDKATGFVFSPFTPEACLDALERALRVFRDKKAWTSLQMRGMKADFSWRDSARTYVDLYRRAIELHAQS